MSELLTAAITVALGFFVFGQIAQRFFIEPIQEQRRVIGEIAYVVLYLGNVGSMSPPEDRLEASSTLRRLSGQLRSTLWTVPCYRLFQILRLVAERGRHHRFGGAGRVVELRGNARRSPRFEAQGGGH